MLWCASCRFVTWSLIYFHLILHHLLLSSSLSLGESLFFKIIVICLTCSYHLCFLQLHANNPSALFCSSCYRDNDMGTSLHFYFWFSCFPVSLWFCCQLRLCPFLIDTDLLILFWLLLRSTDCLIYIKLLSSPFLKYLTNHMCRYLLWYHLLYPTSVHNPIRTFLKYSQTYSYFSSSEVRRLWGSNTSKHTKSWVA